MKYAPCFIGFVLGFTLATLIWIGITVTKPEDTVLSYSKSFCERQGFNSFTIDEHAKVICKNIMKNDSI
jgi:hypothetical protein